MTENPACWRLQQKCQAPKLQGFQLPQGWVPALAALADASAIPAHHLRLCCLHACHDCQDVVGNLPPSLHLPQSIIFHPVNPKPPKPPLFLTMQ